jgi:hypothetical protein
MNVDNGIQFGDLMSIARRRVKVVLGIALVITMADY